MFYSVYIINRREDSIFLDDTLNSRANILIIGNRGCRNDGEPGAYLPEHRQ